MKRSKNAIIKVSACGIFAKPTFKSEMVSQALLDEEVAISGKKNDWYEIQLRVDGYKGWIHEMYLILNADFDKEEKLKNSSYIRSNQYFLDKFSKKPIINEALQMLGKPYLWGGRSFQGYDCSGFVQTCIKSLGVSFPRDAQDQVESALLYEINFEDISTGDLLFFEENGLVTHVAIAISFPGVNKHLHNKGSIYSGEIIHSYGSVKISKIIFDDMLYGVVDDNSQKKIKLYKIMRLKENV